MCNEGCCCKNLTLDGLKRFIISFTVINLILSFIAIFIRAGNTDWYEKALVYLEERNNGTFNNFTFDNCKEGGIFEDDTYCEINGKFLYKPSENVGNQGLYKKWKSVEIIINIIRAIIILIILIYYFSVINRTISNIIAFINENQNDIEEYKKLKHKNNNFLSSLIMFFSSLIALCGVYILIRALALSANMDIGLYEEGDQNPFEECIAINYVIDIAEIILFGLTICFTNRLKRMVNQIQIQSPRNNTIPYHQNYNAYPIQSIQPQNVPNQVQVQVSSVRVVQETITIRNNDVYQTHPLDYV